MIRRELYIRQNRLEQSKKIQIPGTNKRVRCPLPESEWKTVVVPGLRIVLGRAMGCDQESHQVDK